MLLGRILLLFQEKVMSEFIEITSKDNQLIKFVGLLQNSSKQRRNNRLFVLEGLRICLDAFENNIKIDKLIVTKDALNKYKEKIEELKKISDSCYILRDDLFKKISDTNTPQGIIAVAKFPEISKVVSENGRYIALENISDPSNLGAIVRTAEALGVSGIIVSLDGCDPYSPKSLRASMGTLLRMPVFVTDDIIKFIKDNSLRSFACVVEKTAEPIYNCKFNGGDVLLIGNEANGLERQTKTDAEKLVTIPMSGKAESLNAAAAASIAMWEMMKQK